MTEKAEKTRCPRCGYQWSYRGNLMFRRTCPNCGYTFFVNLKKPKEADKK